MAAKIPNDGGNRERCDDGIANVDAVTPQQMKDNVELIVQLASRLKSVLNEIPEDFIVNLPPHESGVEEQYKTVPGTSGGVPRKVVFNLSEETDSTDSDSSLSSDTHLTLDKKSFDTDSDDSFKKEEDSGAEHKRGNSECEKDFLNKKGESESNSDKEGLSDPVSGMTELPTTSNGSRQDPKQDSSNEASLKVRFESPDDIEVQSESRGIDKDRELSASPLMEMELEDVDKQVEVRCEDSIPGEKQQRSPQQALFINLMLYIADIVTDITSGTAYFTQGHIWWGIITIGLVLGTLIVTNCISIFHYRKYYRNQQNILGTTDQQGGKISGISHRKLGRDESVDNFLQSDGPWYRLFLVMHVFQLGLLFRIIYEFFRKKSASSQDKLANDVIRVLRLVGSFIQSAPQLVLQIYIMEHSSEFYWVTGLTVVTIVASFVSFVWIIRTHYAKFMTHEDEKPEKHPWLIETALITSLSLTIVSRVISLALVASLFSWIILVIVGCHCLVILSDAFWYATRHGLYLKLKPHLLTCYATLYIFTCVEHRSFFGKFPWMFDVFVFIETVAIYMIWYLDFGYNTNYGTAVAGLVFASYILGAILRLNLIDNKRLKKYITLEKNLAW